MGRQATYRADRSPTSRWTGSRAPRLRAELDVTVAGRKGHWASTRSRALARQRRCHDSASQQWESALTISAGMCRISPAPRPDQNMGASRIDVVHCHYFRLNGPIEEHRTGQAGTMAVKTQRRP